MRYRHSDFDFPVRGLKNLKVTRVDSPRDHNSTQRQEMLTC
jgi:hypothetical protein